MVNSDPPFKILDLPLYMEMSSRDYISKWVLFGRWFTDLPKITETRIKSFCRNSFQVGMDLLNDDKAHTVDSGC